MMRRVLIALENGPDIRQFVHSGLASDLARDADIVWALGHRASERYLPVADETICLAEILPALPLPLRLVSRLTERACNTRKERRDGQAGWVNFLDTLRARRSSALKRRIDALLSRAPVHRALVAFERALYRHFPVSRASHHRLAALKADTIVLSNYATPGGCGLIWLAKRSGIRTVVMLNSWKDAFARTHVPVAPEVFVVPSQDAADLLVCANPDLESDIQVRDTLHTTQLAEPGRIMDRESFCALHDLDPDRPILCISAAAPNAVHNEPEIVSDLVTRLGHDGPQILIRLNPMEDDPVRWQSLPQRPGLVLQTPEWDYVPAEKWSAPKPKDASIWASTIAHSAINVSVPSTVTRDFLLFDRPVINICFDIRPPESAAESTRRYWNAPFYAPYRNCSRVTPAFSADELAATTKTHLAHVVIDGKRPDPRLAARMRALSRAAILGEIS